MESDMSFKRGFTCIFAGLCYNPDVKGRHMNIIAPNRPISKISAEERARRKAAIDYARGSVRLEGFVVSPFAEDMNQRYIDGEITRKELTAAILAHHAL